MADPFVQTYSGDLLSLTDPDPRAIELSCISMALARQCRFNGHTVKDYSVAEHSVNVEAYVAARTNDRDLRRAALLHDAAEAYIGDITSPVKTVLGPSVRELEDRILLAIAQRFDIPFAAFSHSLVKEADLRLLAAEANQLLPTGPAEEWAHSLPYPAPKTLECWTAKTARTRFLDAAVALELS